MNNDLLFNLEYLNKFKEEMKKINHKLFKKIVYSCSKIKEENIYYVSFNGGKDSLAAYLILKYYLYCIENDINYSHFESLNKFKENQNKIVLNKVVFLYFVSDKHFESEEDYVINFAKKEKIKIFYCYSSYVNGLNYLLKKFDIHTIIMGTRNDDIKNTLNSNIISNSLIESSTKPFPNFNRLYLVFNFSYNEIWRLILFLNSDYLDLYDKGYSSIGDRYNTKINQYLFINNREIFPAWCLLNNDSERAFR